jgi:hypothetical protein
VAHYLNMSVRSVSNAFNLCKVVTKKYIVTDGLLNYGEIIAPGGATTLVASAPRAVARLTLMNKLGG